MVLKKPNFIFTFEEGTPTKEEVEKALVDLIRVFCKFELEEQINNSRFDTKKEKLLTQNYLEDFAAGLLKDIEKNLKNKEK